jgi:hypothetical protein
MGVVGNDAVDTHFDEANHITSVIRRPHKNLDSEVVVFILNIQGRSLDWVEFQGTGECPLGSRQKLKIKKGHSHLIRRGALFSREMIA